MKVELIDHMGSDLSVVNAARVSFAKESEWEVEYLNPSEPLKKIPGSPFHEAKELVPGALVEDIPVFKLSERDSKLIRYLARHNHWTPFGHTAVTFRVKAPIFVARQLAKHQVGLVWNEVSRRYVDDEPELYQPKEWRGRPENSKQGSSDEIVDIQHLNLWKEDGEGWFDPYTIGEELNERNRRDILLYNRLIEVGVCPEQARMVLPQSMYTEWYWTGNIAAFARVCKLRLDPHTQKETQEIAKQIDDLLGPLFPVSWKELLAES